MFKKLITLPIFLFLSLFIGGCFNDLGCLFQFPNEKNQHTLLEVIAKDDLKDFRKLRETSFIGEAVYFTHEFTFFNIRYTLNKNASISEGKLFNYGNKELLFDDKLKIEEFDFNIIDYSPDEKKAILSSSEESFLKLENSLEIDSVYSPNRFLIEYDFNSSSFDTLAEYSSIVIDSTRYKEFRPQKVRYDNRGNTIVKLVVSELNLEFNSVLDSPFPKTLTEESNILRFSTNSVDTLLKSWVSESIDYKLTESEIYVTIFDQGTFTVQPNGELEFITDTYIPESFSIDGTMYLESYSNRIYDFNINSIVELDDFVDNIIRIAPNQDKMILTLRNKPDVFYVFDYNSKAIIDSITIEKIPDFQPVANEDHSFYELRNPIYTEDNNLIFMAIRKSYLTDPDFRCY